MDPPASPWPRQPHQTAKTHQGFRAIREIKLSSKGASRLSLQLSMSQDHVQHPSELSISRLLPKTIPYFQPMKHLHLKRETGRFFS